MLLYLILKLFFQEVSSIYGILAAILHTGNIEFKDKEAEGYAGDAVDIANIELTNISKITSHFLISLSKCVVGTHKKHLTKVLLMSTHKICFCGEINHFTGYLFGGM